MRLLEMLCPCGGQPLDTSPILDIEKIIQDYAWREIRRDTKWYQSCMVRRSSFSIEVPWNFFELEHKTVRFVPRYSGSGQKKGSKSVQLFSTNFKNNTSKEQSYKFMVQRQTKSSTTITYQRGFSIRGNANFKLQIPAAISDVGVSAGIDGQLHITKTTGETFEETFTWETNSDVIVEENHVTTAKMLLTESKCLADFEVRTTLKMPSGEAPIVIKRKSDMEVYAVLLINDLCDIFADTDRSVVTIVKDDDPRKRNHLLQLITTGVIESVGWKDQRIALESHRITELDEYDSIADAYGGNDLYSKVLKQATRDSMDCLQDGVEMKPLKESDSEKSEQSKEPLRFSSDLEQGQPGPVKVKPTIAVRSYSETSETERSAKLKRITFADTRETKTFPRMTSV